MEKIQAALEKARVSRAAAIAPAILAPVAVGRVAPADSGPADHALAWQALTPCEPDPARLIRNRIVTFAGGAKSVPFDVMRTRLIQQMRLNGWRRLAITSPTPGCGKSTVALNLAFSLARQTELRTILAEIDLRRPTLAATMGVSATLRGRPGFARVLEGRAAFGDMALRCRGGLALALNDASERHPAELLHGTAVGPALTAIEARYAPDLMVFDMPPMFGSDDVMAFLGQVDAVLLIAGAETTTVKQIDACERDLATQTNVMGVVLNKCNFMGKEADYDYYG